MHAHIPRQKLLIQMDKQTADLLPVFVEASPMDKTSGSSSSGQG